jgi:hypothetical protein
MTCLTATIPREPGRELSAASTRGIDVDNIVHVINYDLPTEPEMYIHRVGSVGLWHCILIKDCFLLHMR